METKYRKNARLKYYDYSSNGYYPATRLCVLDTPYRRVSGWRGYFVTICANYKKCYFDNPIISQIVVAELALLTKRFSELKIDYYVIMPDHVHIIFILENSRARLSRIIQAFKSITTLKAKQALRLQSREESRRFGAKQALRHIKAEQSLRPQMKGKLWQPNYYEHIIRSEKALRKMVYDNGPVRAGIRL